MLAIEHSWHLNHSGERCLINWSMDLMDSIGSGNGCTVGPLIIAALQFSERHLDTQQLGLERKQAMRAQCRAAMWAHLVGLAFSMVALARPPLKTCRR